MWKRFNAIKLTLIIVTALAILGTVIFTKKSLTGTGVIQQEKLNVDDLQLRGPAVNEGGGVDADLHDDDSRSKQGLLSEREDIKTPVIAVGNEGDGKKERIDIPKGSADKRARNFGTDNSSTVQVVSNTSSPGQNFYERGKWQMEQVDKFCAKYNRQDEALTLPGDKHSERRNLFRHLLFDDERRYLFCFIPKIGCSTMRRFVFVLQGLMPVESINWIKYPTLEQEYLIPGMSKVSFQKRGLTDSERLYKLKNYWKFMIVRNPLERLLSAFLNKLSHPIPKQGTLNEFQRTAQNILKTYNLDLYRVWSSASKLNTQPISLDFESYLKWIIHTANYTLNEHFAPLVVLAQPCRVKYNFYGNFKSFLSDMNDVMEKLHAPKEYFIHRQSAQSTQDLMIEKYSVVSKEVKQQLVRHIYEDLDFYYSLYPEEADSHNYILGLI